MTKYFETSGRLFLALGLTFFVACSDDQGAELNQIQTAAVDDNDHVHTVGTADGTATQPRVRTKTGTSPAPIAVEEVKAVEPLIAEKASEEMPEAVEEVEAPVVDATPVDPSMVLATLQAPAVPSSFKLLSNNKVEIPVTVSGEYEGNLNFAIDRAGLDLVDLAKEVVISMEVPSMAVTKGQVVMASIDVVVASSSPMLAGEKFTLVVSSDNANIEPVKVDIMFSTIPEIDILLFGGPVAANQPEKWSTDGLGALSFRQAVKVNFTNMDNVNHRIHFNVGALHQDDNLANAQTYTVDLAEDGNFNFYCHNHEAGAMRQDVTFVPAQ